MGQEAGALKAELQSLRLTSQRKQQPVMLIVMVVDDNHVWSMLIIMRSCGAIYVRVCVRITHTRTCLSSL